MPPITRKEFAAKIKEKYPDYAGVDDSVLVEKMVAKYPEYREQISDYDTQKKNDSATIAKPSGNGSAPTPSKLPLQEGSGFAQVGDPIKPQGTFTPEPVENVPRETLPNSSTQRLFTSDGGRVASDNTKTGLSQDIARPQTKEEKQLTAEQIQTKEDNTKIAIDKSAKALAKAKGLTYDKAKADIEERVNRGEAVLGYVDGEPGLKRVNSFNESFKKSLIETHKATQGVKAFNQMSAADKVAWVEKQQQPKEADPNSEYVGQIESGVGQLLGENAEMMAKGGVAAGIGGGLNALSGGTLALLSPTLQFVAFAPDMAAHKSQQEVLKRYNALRAEHPLVDKVDLMKEAEKGQLPGAIAGMAEAAAFSLPGVTSGIKPAYKTMVGKAVGESLKSGINAATITAGSETGLAALRSAQGIETKPGEDVAAIADAAKGNFEFGTAIHMMAGELVPGAAKMPKRIKSLVKFAVTKDNPNAVEDAAKLAHANVELGTITPEVANELVTDLKDYKTALDQVQQPGMKPEVEASVAGLQQKINNLVEKKQGQENPEIDNEIAATNKQIDAIKSGKKPEEVEVDEVTGEPIGKATEPTKTQPNEQPNATGDTSLGDKANEPISSETSKNNANGNNISDTYEGIHRLESHEATLSESEMQTLQALRRQRDSHVRGLEKQLQDISKRYGAEAKPESFSRQDKQQWELLQRELQMGYESAAGGKPGNIESVSSQGRNENGLEDSKGGGDKRETVGEPVDKSENAGGGGAKELGVPNRDNDIKLQGEGNFKDGAGKRSGDESITPMAATEKGNVTGGSSSDAKGGGNGRTGKEGEGSKVEPVAPKANDTVTLPPSIKGGMERKFVFENGEWKQDVGTQKTRVGEPLQKQAQAEFDKINNKPNEVPVTAKKEVIAETSPIEVSQKPTEASGGGENAELVQPKRIYDEVSENIFNETSDTIKGKVADLKKRINEVIQKGIKKWGSKKEEQGYYDGSQSEKMIDVPNLDFSDPRFKDGIFKQVDGKTILEPNPDFDPNYHRDLIELNDLRHDIQSVNDLNELHQKDYSYESTEKLKGRLGSIVFRFGGNDANKVRDAFEANKIMQHLTNEGEKVDVEKIISTYKDADASEGQIQKFKNNAAEITEIINNKGVKKQEIPKQTKELLAPKKLLIEPAKTQPKNEVPVEAKKAEPTKTEPNKNSQEASKGEATTKEEPKPEPKVSEPEPPKTPPPKTPNPEPIEGEGKGGNTDKAILNRLLNADGTPKAAKEGFQKEGLNYKPSSQAEAAEIAKSVIDSEGMDNALLMAGAGKFKGDTNSLIYAESLNRLAKAETEAKTTQEKIDFAKRYAEVAIEYDKAARDKGQFISAVNYFYKKSPLGIKIVEETKRQEAFNEYAKSKDKSWKEFYNELVKEPEFEEIIKTEVREQLKQERAEARSKRKEKVHTIIDDAIKQFKNSGATYSTLVPPKVITTALEGIKKAYDAGEKVVEIVQKAIDYISKEIGTEWDSEKFREEWEKRLGKIEGTRDKKEMAADQKEKILERFRKKLKGMNEEQKDKVVRGAFKKLVENGALEYDDFKQIIGDVLGYGKLTPEESRKLTELVNDINSVDEIGRKAREEDRTPEALKAYQDAKKKAEKSATELGQIVYSKPDVVNRLLSIMQLNTLGIPSLVNNPIFNVWNQATVRFPIGIQLTVLDQMLYGASKITDKLFGTGVLLPENNVFKGQGAFWSKLGIGAKQSTEQLFSGLTNADYFQKEVRTSQIHPFTSAKELWEFAKGNKPLTKAQLMDKGLQATVGVPAEIVARALNIGDKPQRYAAEGAQAAVFAKNLGLEGVDYKYFMEFPKEEAYRKYKAMGLSDAVATKKAEQIQERIIKQGEESTFQQDNLLNDAINAAFKPFGVAGEVVKKFNMPFVKIPLNAFWSVFNLVNPEVALMQSAIYGVKAMKSKSPLDIQQSKKWLAHAATGMATMAAVGALAKKGVINPSNDDDVTKKERQGERTYEQQNTINMSKLAAYMRGDDPSKVKGGLDVDLKWFGNIGQVMNFQAKKIEDLTPEQKQHALEFSESLLQNLKPSALELIQSGVFSNTSALFTALDKGGEFGNTFLLNLINMGTNIVQPAMFAQMSRAQLPYYSKQKADSFYEEVKNNMLARSSFLRNLTGQAPKASVGAWGDKLDRPDNVLLKWFGMSKKNMDNFAQPIYEDYKRTGNTKFLPPAVMPMIDKQKLSVAETEKLEILVGKARKDLVAPYVNKMATLEGYDKKYNKLSDDQKIEALNILYEEGFKKGKEQFLSLPAYKKYIKAEKTDEQKDETKEKAKFRKSQK